MNSLKADAATDVVVLNQIEIEINARIEWINNTNIKHVNEISKSMNHLWFL